MTRSPARIYSAPPQLRPALAILLITACCLPACSKEPAADPNEQQAAAGSVRAESDWPTTGEVRMTVYKDRGNSPMQTFDDPDEALIEKHVRAMNWQDARQLPYVHISRLPRDSRGSYLKLQGAIGTPNVDGNFRAIGYCSVDSSGRRLWHGESPPLPSVDAGLELLLLFRRDPQKLDAVVRDWKTEDD